MPGDRSNLLSRLSRTLGFQSDWYLIAIGAIVGTLTGLGAVGFAQVLHALEHLVFDLHFGRLQPLEFLRFEKGPLRGGIVWLIITPFIGMGLTGLLVHFFASEAKGHGVPQVMKALIARGGKIPARIGIVKVIASILTVGSGGSAGTEGPIVQIGSVLGSQVGKVLRLDRQGMQTLVGCGAAAGISAIFNAPIAGVFFVIEILVRDFSVRIFTPIVVASVFSQVTAQVLVGDTEAIFPVDSALHDLQFRPQELPSYIGLGLVCGLVALLFNRILHRGEDLFEKFPVHPLIKPLVGALGLSLLGVAWVVLLRGGSDPEDHGSSWALNVPPFFGNGYIFIERLLDPGTYEVFLSAEAPAEVYLLAVVVACKLIGTTLTLASGGSGGVFAPSLFLGAASGGLVGVVLERMGLMPEGSTPASYALVGMAAVVAASTHAPLTAILILFELTRNVYVVLPIMLSAVIATVMAQVIDRDSVYTYRLRQAGLLTGAAKDLTLLRRITVSEVELTPLPHEPVYAADPVSKLIGMHATHAVPDFPVVDEKGGYLGMVTGSAVRSALIDREAIPLLLVAEIMRHDIPTVTLDEALDSVLRKFTRHDVTALCVVSKPDATRQKGTPLSLISRGRVMQRYDAELESRG